MGEVSLTTLAFFTAIILFAGLVHGTLGLGFPLMATPLLALFVDVRSAILITLLPTVAVNVASILHGGQWRDSIGRYWPLAVYALIGSVVGTSFIVVSDPALATPPRGILYFRDEEAGSDFGPLMAAATVITAPLVIGFLMAQRKFIQGITMSGLKE
jgi:hypothetical protein